MADIEKHMTIAAAPEAVRAAVLDATSATVWQGSLSEYEQTSPDPAGLGNNISLFCMLFGIKYVVFQLMFFQVFPNNFGLLD